MRTLRVAMTTAFLVSGMAGVASAQVAVRGFAGGGFMTESNDQHFPSVSGGVVVDLGQPWIAIGAQAETFWSGPYFGGRAAWFGQGTVLTKKPARPFALLGQSFGESRGVFFGGGIEIRPAAQRHGVRIAFEDYPTRFTGGGVSRVEHQVALRVGILF
jgi:hypothetical protein